MKGNRDMIYGNYQAGAYQEPNMIYTPAQGYNINTQYSAFGPGVYQGNQNMMQPNMNAGYQNSAYSNGYGSYIDEYDERISKIERQIRSLDQRIRKLEANNTNIDDNSINDSNLYML